MSDTPFEPGTYGQNVLVEYDVLVAAPDDIRSALVSSAVRSFEAAVNRGARSLSDLVFSEWACDVPECDHGLDKPHGLASWRATFS